MSILLQQKNVGDYSYMSSPNIYYRAKISMVVYVKQQRQVERINLPLLFVWLSMYDSC